MQRLFSQFYRSQPDPGLFRRRIRSPGAGCRRHCKRMFLEEKADKLDSSIYYALEH